jgi:hypothetical protein
LYDKGIIDPSLHLSIINQQNIQNTQSASALPVKADVILVKLKRLLMLQSGPQQAMGFPNDQS